jgi:L-iditol 2-dehydrogenase
MMRAAVYHGPGDLRVEDRPRPEIGPDEALLRVAGCGICGTDHRIVAGGHGSVPPGTLRVPGHEIVGEIVDAGTGLRETLPEGPVFVAPNMGCGRCGLCLSGNNNRCPDFQAIGITLDGAFAEYVRIPAAAIAQGNVIPLRPDIDLAEATLIEPLACVLRGQERLDIRPADRVLVIGAGPIGILHVMLARLKDAGRVIIADRHLHRLEFARRQGADVTIDVSERSLEAAVMAETASRGADVVIVAAQAPEAFATALELCADFGRVSWFAGLPKERARVAIDANLVHYRELRVTGTTGCSTLDCRRSADIVNSGRLELGPLVTRRLPLEESTSEFRVSGARDTIKTVLIP